MGVFIFPFCSPVTFSIIGCWGSRILPLGLLWQHLREFTKLFLVWILSPCLTIFLPLYNVLWGNVNYIWVILTLENMCLKGYLKAGDGGKKIKIKWKAQQSEWEQWVRGGRLYYFLKLSLYVSVAWELLNTDKCIINVSMWQKTLFLFWFGFFCSANQFLVILLHYIGWRMQWRGITGQCKFSQLS